MMATHQITRLVQSQDHSRIVDRILLNGRCRSVLARRALRQPWVVKPAAIGLALQRLIELSYRPTPMADVLANQLLVLQDQSGLFGSRELCNGDGDDRRRAATPLRGLHPGAQPTKFLAGVLGASAVALHGLVRWLCQHDAREFVQTATAAEAVERGIDAIAERFAQQRESREWAQFAIDWAIVLWQLGDVEAFRARVPIDELLDMLDAADSDLLDDELCQHAQAAAA